MYDSTYVYTCTYIARVLYICTVVFRVYEKIMERMQEIGSTVTGFKRTLADWAKKKGLEGNQNFIKK